MESGVVPEDWKVPCTIPEHKWKGDRRDCANYRGICVISIPGKLYRMDFITSRVKESTKEQVEEEQGLFRSGSGNIDKIFLLKQLVEKYRERKKEGTTCCLRGPGEGL